MYRFAKVTMALILALSLISFAGPQPTPTQADAGETYIVLYKQEAVPADAARVIERAGGTLVYSYDQIGVTIAWSDNASFRDSLLKDKRVEGAAATAGFATKLNDELETFDSVSGASSWGDSLSYLQWDMVQIHVPEAHAINTGSPSVVVGDIDTGLDYTHPDLAANVDFANSVSCVGGVPNQDPAAWDDNNGHGTHTAGTIAAAANGIGIVGVAPNVKIAGIKAGNDDGYFFPEAVICAFMWAGSHDIDVTNNSYFADPWLFNCRNDHEQHAIWKAEQRAIRYAMQQGVTVVAAEGNENIDLSKKNVDTISPDFPPGSEQEREVTNACVVIPVEISGVVGVTANGYNLQKSYYSSYGVGVTQVVAPGGDRRFQIPPAPISNGRVLSTFPGGYAWLQGTSMASPHAAGVAALIVSQFGKMAPGRVQAIINQTADPQPCPTNPFNPGPPFDFLAECQGGDGYNSFYGHGQVNAFKAVTHSTGQ
jgi:subtilisin family serine protease